MKLKNIYQSIKKELIDVENLLRYALKDTSYKSILKLSDYMLSAKGKRLRPALVILSAKASLHGLKKQDINSQLTKIAAAIELIHIATLIHDDVIDHARLRHNKLTINRKWGNDVSIAFGDYIYSVAFELISSCGNTSVLGCISSATKAMCEGELIQVCERDNLDLLKQRYIFIVKKKTAALFAASCRTGAMLANHNRIIQDALKEYGLNFGIAFQIIDDCLDLVGEAEDLGKSPGSDFKMGELTLPVLNLISQTKDKDRLMFLLKNQPDRKTFEELKQRFINSLAIARTKQDISSYVERAKKSLYSLDESCFKQSLIYLADYITERIKI